MSRARIVVVAFGLGFAGCADLVGIEDATSEVSLASLEVMGGALEPAFDPSVHAYEIALTYSHASIEIAAQSIDPAASVLVDNMTRPQGALHYVAVPIGSRTIEVVARTTSGVESRYTITARRADFTIELVPGTPVTGIGMVTHATVADMNRDGARDLVYSAPSAGVGVVFGDGAGKFRSGMHLGFATVRGVAVANVMGDSAPDLVVADGSLLLIKNRGDGTFDSPFPRGLSDASAIGVGQLDGGGPEDIVVTNGSSWVTTLFGDGAQMIMGPTWQSPVQFEPRVLAVGDVDGQPGNEVVQLDGTMNSIFVSTMSNPGTGFSLTLPAAAAPREMILADVDSDGRSEIVWLDPFIGVLDIQKASALMTRTAIPLGGWATGLAAGDVDGDGFTDLVTLQNDALVLLHNDGHGTMIPIRFPGLAAGATSVSIADLDADGRGDVILPKNVSSIAIYFGRVP